MGKLTLTILNIIFFIPIIILTLLFYKKKIIQYKKLLIFAAVFGFIGFFVVDPLATSWGAWGFDYSQTLGITIGKSVFEVLVWAVIIAPVLALAITIFAEQEEKKVFRKKKEIIVRPRR